jgi:hypothetical protein
MSSVFLWVGFLAAFLIFVAVVIGSAMYFTRSVEKQQAE